MGKFKKLRALGASVLGLVAVSAAHAQAVIPDMAAEVDDAKTTITSVLVIVGATAVFFTILAIYKWVKKR